MWGKQSQNKFSICKLRSLVLCLMLNGKSFQEPENLNERQTEEVG
jgi:hypothetical protein